jgi:hypothetical protein
MVPGYKQLQTDIIGRELILGKRIFELPEDQDPNNLGLPCPNCKDDKQFRFRQQNVRFRCERCGYSKELIQFVTDSKGVSHNEAYDIIVEALANIGVDEVPGDAEPADPIPSPETPEPEQGSAEQSDDAVPEEPEFNIDPEFESLLPSRTSEQDDELKEMLLREGCRDPFVTWDEEGILLDGHNRYAICRKHGIQYTVRRLPFADRDAAKEWVLRNQLARRNLNSFQSIEVALKFKSLFAARAKANQHAGVPLKLGEGGETVEAVAKLAGVSSETVRRVERILERADEADVVEAVNALRRGDAGISIHSVYKEHCKEVKPPPQQDDAQEETGLSDSPGSEEQSDGTTNDDAGSESPQGTSAEPPGEVPTETGATASSAKTSKTLSKLTDRFIGELKTLPTDSQRQDVVLDHFKAIISCFEDSKERRKLLQALKTESVEYGV